MKLGRTLKTGLAALVTALLLFALSACVEEVGDCTDTERDLPAAPVIYSAELYPPVIEYGMKALLTVETNLGVIVHVFYDNALIMANDVSTYGDKLISKVYVSPKETQYIRVMATRHGSNAYEYVHAEIYP